MKRWVVAALDLVTSRRQPGQLFIPSGLFSKIRLIILPDP